MVRRDSGTLWGRHHICGDVCVKDEDSENCIMKGYPSKEAYEAGIRIEDLPVTTKTSGPSMQQPAATGLHFDFIANHMAELMALNSKLDAAQQEVERVKLAIVKKLNDMATMALQSVQGQG